MGYDCAINGTGIKDSSKCADYQKEYRRIYGYRPEEDEREEMSQADCDDLQKIIEIQDEDGQNTWTLYNAEMNACVTYATEAYLNNNWFYSSDNPYLYELDRCSDNDDSRCLINGVCRKDLLCPVGADMWPLAILVVGYALLILYRFCYGCKIKPKRQLEKEKRKQEQEAMNPNALNMGMPGNFNMQQPMYNAQIGQWNQ